MHPRPTNSMIKRLTNAAKRALGQTPSGRFFEVFADDVFIVSYPRSGNTWTRFLIANLLHPEDPANFGNIDRLIPESEEMTSRQAAQIPRPRILKSHQYFDARFRKVLYIVRDPRDVAVSQFHYERKRRRTADDYSIDQFVPRFVAGETCDYGPWGGHVASWLVTRYQSPSFMLLRYEDLVEQTSDQLTRVAAFLGIRTSPALISQAVQRSSADQMRRLERKNATASVTKNTRSDIPFVRAAGSGNWKTSLSDVSALQLETAWAPLMQWLGYESATANPAPTSAAKAGMQPHPSSSGVSVP